MEAITSQLAGLAIENPAEEILWLDNPSVDPPNLTKEALVDWMRFGTLNTSVDSETHFCDPDLLSTLITTLAGLNKFSDQSKNLAGRRANKFEAVGKIFFSSRSALKFANIDALIKLTNPEDPSGNPLIRSDEQISYVDLTNSTDYGFIEYMQWRKGEYAHGFAFKNRTDELWSKYTEMRPKSSLIATIYGDSKKTSTIRSFVKSVLSRQPRGVHLTCSDGLDVDQKFKGIREVLLKRPTMCNCIMGLMTVAENGTFIIKITVSVTMFMVGLLYLVRMFFRQMSVFKPVTSRPANAEKYVVFRSKLPGTDDVLNILVEHLLSINDKWSEMVGKDVLELVPLDVLRNDVAFFDYITKSNNELIRKQLPNIRERISQCENPHQLIAKCDGTKIRDMCFRLWNLPQLDDILPTITVKQSMADLQPHRGYIPLSWDIFHSTFDKKSSIELSDWCFTPIHGEQPTFIVSEKDKPLTMWDGSDWQPLVDLKFDIPPGTVLYGTLLQTEFRKGNDKLCAVKKCSLHLVDMVIYKNKDYRRAVQRVRQEALSDLVENHSTESAPMHFSKVQPMAQLPRSVSRWRKFWSPVNTDRSKRLMLQYGSQVSLPLVGLLVFDSKAIHVERPLFWDWTKDTFNLLNNEQAFGVNLCAFERMLSGR